MASERQTNTLPGLLAVKMIRQQISLTVSHTSPPPLLTSGGNDELEPNTADLRVAKPPIMRRMNIHKNIPVCQN